VLVPLGTGGAYSVGMTRENGSDKDQPVQESDPHMGPVPDKQLHRWKGEGGALPPEPVRAPENDNEDEGGH
jgi:hypothetical protein